MQLHFFWMAGLALLANLCSPTLADRRSLVAKVDVKMYSMSRNGKHVTTFRLGRHSIECPVLWCIET